MKRILIFVITIVTLAGCTAEPRLPFYGQRETCEVKNDKGDMVVDTIYKTIPDWKFLNQDSVYITQSDFAGKVYIADFFFTSCTSICPTMHRNMKSIYDMYKDDDRIMYLSHTIDFKYDKPSVLDRYAKKLGVDKRWQFVWGAKDSVYRLAEKDYLVAVKEDSTERDGYIHQGYLMLIDKQRRIRGAYDGTKDEEVEKLKKDLAILLKEE